LFGTAVNRNVSSDDPLLSLDDPRTFRGAAVAFVVWSFLGYWGLGVGSHEAALAWGFLFAAGMLFWGYADGLARGDDGPDTAGGESQEPVADPEATPDA
jgi:hypothetical protein